MRNSFQIATLFYQLLNTVALTANLTGSVYKGARPLNSSRQDVVISPLPVDNQQLQQAVVNVNIHVPNLQLEVSGQQDNSQPDHKKLGELTAIVIELLDDYIGDDYYITLQQQVMIQDPDTLTWYSNIRFDFINENISN